MSSEYKIEVVVNPVYEEDEGVAQTLLEKWGMHVDGCQQVAEYTWNYWGHKTLTKTAPSEAHDQIRKILDDSELSETMQVVVTTRWRCIDYDEWDEVIGGMVVCPKCGESGESNPDDCLVCEDQKEAG